MWPRLYVVIICKSCNSHWLQLELMLKYNVWICVHTPDFHIMCLLMLEWTFELNLKKCVYNPKITWTRLYTQQANSGQLDSKGLFTCKWTLVHFTSVWMPENQRAEAIQKEQNAISSMYFKKEKRKSLQRFIGWISKLITVGLKFLPKFEECCICGLGWHAAAPQTWTKNA